MFENDILIGERFKIGPKLGHGSNGDVFLGLDTSTDTCSQIFKFSRAPTFTNANEVAIKVAKGPFLSEESSRYHTFLNTYYNNAPYNYYPNTIVSIYPKSIRGLPKIIWSGYHTFYYCIVYELLGPTLEDLFKFCKKFNRYTALFLGEQILDRLKLLHENGYTHGSVKPENMAMGATKRTSKTVYLFDFGSLQPIKFPKDHRSNRLWKSVHRSNGASEHTIRDDLISWMYVIAYLLQGSLPWDSELVTRDYIERNHHDIEHISKADITRKYKETKTLSWMTKVELDELWNYVIQLEAFQVPDYRYIKKLLRKQLNAETDKKYSWLHIKEKNKRQLEENEHIKNAERKSSKSID